MKLATVTRRGGNQSHLVRIYENGEVVRTVKFRTEVQLGQILRHFDATLAD